MANFVFVFFTCALFVVVVTENQFCYQNPSICGVEAGCQPVGEDGYVCLCHDLLPAGANNSCDRIKGDGEFKDIPSNNRTSVPPEKEIEDFTDSEYIPVVDKENINTTDVVRDKSSTKIFPSPLLQSTSFPGVNEPVFTLKNEFKNTIRGQSSSVTEATSISSTSKVQRILSQEKSSVQFGKEIEDFTDSSEYIPVGDKENISTTDDLKDESSTKISPSFTSQSTPFPEVKVSVSTSENELQNTIKERSNSPTEATSISSEKTPSSLDDTSVMTNELSLTPEEKQHSSTEDLNISDEINISTSGDTSTNSNDASFTSNASTNSDDMNSTTDASTRSDDASFSTDVSNDKPDSSSVSGISVSLTSSIPSSSENSSLVTDLSTSNSDSTSGEVLQFTTSDATPTVSKDASAITSTPTVSKDASTFTSTPTASKDASTITSTPTDLSSTIVSLKSTASTEELVSNTVFTVPTSEATSKDIIETTVSSDEPYIDKSTTITEVTSSQSSISTTTTSTTSEVTEDHLRHITMPGLKKVKIGLAITFLTVAVIAMAGIIIYMIKMRRTTIDYEELSLVP